MNRFILIVVSLGFLVAQNAPAQILRYEFGGTVDTITPPTAVPGIWASAGLGDPIVVAVNVDALKSPSFSGATQARYDHAMLSYEVVVNGVEASGEFGIVNQLLLTDDLALNGQCRDALRFLGLTAGSPGVMPVAADVLTVTADIVESLNLPACPTSLTSLDFPRVVDLSLFTSPETRISILAVSGSTFSFVPTSSLVTVGNDNCEGATALPANFADTPYEATNATTDGLAAGINCDYGPFGDEQNYHDIWFTYTPDVGGCTYISTLGLAGYDTRLTIYSGYGCPDVPQNIIACADDEIRVGAASPFEAGLDVDLVAGQTYTVRLGTNDPGTAPGSGVLRIAQGPGADINSGGLNPGAPGCQTRRIPLNYNFNGIVHVGEAGIPDSPAGFRSIANRALDFQLGVPRDALLDQYYLVDQPGQLDLVHLGNRNLTLGSSFAFDAAPDGDNLGVQPNWLPSVDQTGVQTTVLPAPVQLQLGASASLLCQGTTGGQTFDTTFDFAGGNSVTFTRFANDWLGGPYVGVDSVDAAQASTMGLNLTEIGFDLSPHTGETVMRVSFSSGLSNDAALAVCALNIDAGERLTPVNDDCVSAIVLPSNFADTAYDPLGATTDGSDLLGFCDYGPFGDELSHRDIWFTYTPDLGGCTYISTFGLAGYDTRLTVYDSPNCPDDPASVIACADDEAFPATAPFEAGLDVMLNLGQTYLIRVGTSVESGALAAGVLRIAPGPKADVNSSGNNPGAPGCGEFIDFCNGDGGDQFGCTNCPCSNNAALGSLGGCLNSAGISTRLLASGDPSVSLIQGSSEDLRFGVIGAPPLVFCILNSGDAAAPGGMANPCFGLKTGAQAAAFDGLRCAILNTRRHGGRSADEFGRVGAINNPWGGEGSPPSGLARQGVGFVAGQKRFFQVIHRDDPLAGCMRGFNTSQAIEVTFKP